MIWGLFGIILVSFWRCFPPWILLSQKASWNIFSYHLLDTFYFWKWTFWQHLIKWSHGSESALNSHSKNWADCTCSLYSPPSCPQRQSGNVAREAFHFLVAGLLSWPGWVGGISGSSLPMPLPSSLCGFPKEDVEWFIPDENSVSCASFSICFVLKSSCITT